MKETTAMAKGRWRGGWPSAPAIALACLIGAHVATARSASAEAAATPPPRAVFAGYDSQVHLNLWVTDGTSGGTQELIVASASPNGLFSSYANEPVGSRIARPEFTPLGKELLFVGNDKAGKLGLWVTDGTVTGTRELIVAGAYHGGLFTAGGEFGGVDPQFTVLGRKALFAGHSSRGVTTGNPIPTTGLWVTDGTSGGTREIKVAGASSAGLQPGPFVAIGSKVLFSGFAAEAGSDFGGRFGLWVTDGTTGGTKELSIAGANLGGVFQFNNPDFVVLGGRVLFQGADTGQITRFWTTDGTSAGTREVKVGREVLNAEYNVGPQLTVFGRRALFVGHALTQRGASERFGLWVTNGSVAGTKELDVSGDFAAGLFQNGVVPEFTGFRGKVLFAGLDRSGRCGLWVTDWTSAGTVRLRVPGSSRFGLFGGCSDPGFTPFRGKVMFNGYDGKGFNESPQANLWVTDGTSAGTRELTVAGALSIGLNPTGFAVLGARVLFSGANARDFIGLWTTDGTAAGTGQVVVPEAWSGGLFATNITALPP
ncbi:MAG: hypothetical protein ACREET_00815 [Stellaceae bacterium]